MSRPRYSVINCVASEDADFKYAIWDHDAQAAVTFRNGNPLYLVEARDALKLAAFFNSNEQQTRQGQDS